MARPRRFSSRAASGRLSAPAAARAEYSPREWPATKAALSESLKSALVLQHAQHGQADRHQGRLGVLGQGQIRLRPLEHEPAQALAQRIVDLLEDEARRAEGLGERTPHADGLGSLAREDEAGGHSEFSLCRPPPAENGAH